MNGVATEVERLGHMEQAMPERNSEGAEALENVTSRIRNKKNETLVQKMNRRMSSYTSFDESDEMTIRENHNQVRPCVLVGRRSEPETHFLPLLGTDST